VILKQPGIVKDRGSRRDVFCDFDQDYPPRLVTIWRTLAQVGIRPRFVRYDRTAHGWHVIVRFRRGFTSGELVALQMALGSDRKRERYNLRRVICGARPRDWNLLFANKL
jgi:hypothetical protein